MERRGKNNGGCESAHVARATQSGKGEGKGEGKARKGRHGISRSNKERSRALGEYQMEKWLFYEHNERAWIPPCEAQYDDSRGTSPKGAAVRKDIGTVPVLLSRLIPS